MPRLQGNLAYLAAIADRHHKPSDQIPSHPLVMSAPPLTPRSSNPNTSSSPKTSPPSNPTKADTAQNIAKEEKKDSSIGQVDDVDRPERLKELYRKLQALFPGVDPKKDQSMQQMNAAAIRA